MIKAKNRKNNVVSEFTPEQWQQVKNDPRYKNIFVEVPTLEALPEVKELRERQAAQAKQETPETGITDTLASGEGDSPEGSANIVKRTGKAPKNDKEEQPQ